ncbi:MAG: cell surface receptor domain protein [Chitinophagaceae bacterium]|nr:cell surface receptor domain protein [Chitinophagaceae bacterium]
MKKMNFYFSALLFVLLWSSTLHAQNLVAWYKFDGNANDASANTNNGTVTGATLTTDRFGKSNSAYSFNGTSDYISVPHHSSLNVDNLTITAWIYATSTPAAYNGIIHKRTNADRAAFSTAASTSSFRLSVKQTDGNYNEPSIASQITTGSWQHVAYVFDGGTIKLYLNGSLVLTNTTYTGKALSYSSVAMEIGRTLWFPSGTATYYYWNGKIDDLKMYDGALSACQITAQANVGQNLVAWYNFDGNANDGSVNTNNGTVTGASLTTDRFGKTNSAYSFNGTSNYISVPHDATLNVSNLTITAWIYANTTSSAYNGILHKRTSTDQNAFSTSASTSSFRFSEKNTDGTTYEPTVSGSISTGSWQHIAYVYNGGTVTLYLNGTQVLNDATYTGKTLSSSAVPMEIGKTLWFPSGTATYFFWDGKIDDLKIYGRALPACEIQGMSSATSTSFAREESQTTTTDTEADNAVRVFPNPLGKGDLTIDGTDIISVKIIDNTGTELKHVTSGFDQIRLDASAGQYILLIEKSDGTVVKRKIIKE